MVPKKQPKPDRVAAIIYFDRGTRCRDVKNFLARLQKESAQTTAPVIDNFTMEYAESGGHPTLYVP